MLARPARALRQKAHPDPTRARSRPAHAARRAILLCGALTLAAGVPGSGATAAGKPPKTKPRTIYRSTRLWATVNLCNPKDHPDTIGVRGSMPGDGQAGETMYMRFRVQYQDPRTKQWVFVASNADSGFLPVGSARFSARQSGRSFEIVPTKGQPFLLRGAVSFEWRRGTTAVRSAHVHTTAGHSDASGSDPKGYTAATCTI
jgi:hypothetical protein